MIEINYGTFEERIIKLLQKTYPITVEEIQNKLKLSALVVLRVLKKLQIKRIVRLEPLSDKTYVRLLRHDFSFVNRKRQRKSIKLHTEGKLEENEKYDGMMYT